jgi:hypothetical protein
MGPAVVVAGEDKGVSGELVDRPLDLGRDRGVWSAHCSCGGLVGLVVGVSYRNSYRAVRILTSVVWNFMEIAVAALAAVELRMRTVEVFLESWNISRFYFYFWQIGDT